MDDEDITVDESADGTMEVVNPATLDVVGVVTDSKKGTIDNAIASASNAFPSWSGTPLAERRAALMRISEAIVDGIELLTELLVSEVGKPTAQARREVKGAAATFRHYAEAPFEPISHLLSDNTCVEGPPAEDAKTLLESVPVGPSALILPWNYPLTVFAWKCAPALLAGNPIVVKPAPTAPLAVSRACFIASEHLPEGAVNVVTGLDDAGRRLVSSPDIAKVSFTGHIETGREVMCGASGTLKAVTLELGGNDPAIIMDDFDMSKLGSVFWSSFTNAGQICIAIKRLYVHDAIYDEFVGKYVETASNLLVGDPSLSDTQMGPIQNLYQEKRIEMLVDDALDNGAKALVGGKTPIPEQFGPGMFGFFYPPTVLVDVVDDMRSVAEEQFGPVVPIMSFSDIDDAVEAANATEYGLGASVWSADAKKALDIAGRLEAGTVWINKHAAIDLAVPFGGFRQSGLGKELGLEGLAGYTRTKAIHL